MARVTGHPYRLGQSKRAIWNRVHIGKPLWRRPPINRCKLTATIFEGQQRRLGKKTRYGTTSY